MRPPMPPTRRDTRSSWVIVSDYAPSTRSRSRSPQLNPNNMCSGQVANASASNGSSSSIFLWERQDDDMFEPAYRVDHVPPSFGSNDTAGTDETVVGPTATVTTSVAPVPPKRTERSHPPLTDAALNSLQRELSQRWAPTVDGWLGGAEPRFLIEDYHALHRGQGHGGSSMSYAYDSSILGSASRMAAGGRSPSGPSGSSVGGSHGGAALDSMLLPAPMVMMVADEQVVAVGAWCYKEGVERREY